MSIMDFKSNTLYVSQNFYKKLLELADNDSTKLPNVVIVNSTLDCNKYGNMVDVKKVEEMLNTKSLYLGDQ